MAILNDDDHAGIVAWLSHGRGFLIFKKKQFETDVMPKFFSKHSKFTSFTRKLNRWGFVRVTRGPEMGAYYNKLFQRDDPTCCLKMTCQKSNGPGLRDSFAVVDRLPYARNQTSVSQRVAMQNHQLQQEQFYQQQQQHQQILQSDGFGMESLHQPQNFFEVQQQQHMQLLMRHREQMLHREALLRGNVQRGGCASAGGRSFATQQQVPMSAMNPHQLNQYQMDSVGRVLDSKSILQTMTSHGVLQLNSGDDHVMRQRDQRQQQNGGEPMSQSEMMGMYQNRRMM